MDKSRAFNQLIRYSIVGITANIFGYAVYILLTVLGISPKISISVLYSALVIIGFFANRRFTFGHNDHIGITVIRYLVVQLFGYLLNLSLLVMFVDWLGFSHQLVQFIAIIVVAIFLFVLTRFFVFIPQRSKIGTRRYEDLP